MDSNGNLVFFGGVHGVGKSYLKSFLASQIEGACDISASRLLDWKSDCKHVESCSSMEYNQRILSSRILAAKSECRLTLLDGHFCLMLKDGSFSYVGDDIFMEIKPALIICVVSEAATIANRILQRDGTCFPTHVIETLQQMEISYSQRAAEISNSPLIIFNNK